MAKNLFSKNGKIIKKLYHNIKEILSPKFCFSCLKYKENYICYDCLRNIDFEISFFCFKCGKRIPFNSNCHYELIKFLISFSDYENKFLSNLILQGKTNGFFEIFSDLGKHIANQLQKYSFENYSLAFIPLTYKKFLKRGFNQAEILAKSISQTLDLPIFDGLIKIKETKDQAELSYEERLINLKNAFSLKSKPPRKIILIDDIKTTGSTLKEAAKILKQNGAKEIIGLTILK